MYQTRAVDAQQREEGSMKTQSHKQQSGMLKAAVTSLLTQATSAGIIQFSRVAIMPQHCHQSFADGVQLCWQDILANT